jgi:hypothetical protein
MTLPETILEFEMRSKRGGRGLSREEIEKFRAWMDEDNGENT